MIDAIDLLSLETSVRDLIGEETAKFFTQAALRRAVNAEVSRLCRKVCDLDAGYFETSVTYTPAETLTLPANCYVVRNVEAYAYGYWQPVRWIGAHETERYQDTGSVGLPLNVRLAENSLVFTGGVTAASSIRVTYARSVANLQSYSVTSAAATTAVLSDGTVYDDVYNGDRVLVSSGTGIGQVRTISDWVASTLTITVATWGTNPDTDSVITWCLPDPLHKWSDVVALGTAVRLVGRRRDTETHSVLMAQYIEDLNDMMTSLAARQTDQVQRVNYIPDGSE